MHMCSNVYLSRKKKKKRKRGGLIRKHHHTGGEGSDLGTLSRNPFENCLVRRVAEATLDPLFLILLVPFAQSLGAIVEGVSEWFVDAGQSVVTSHEDLEHVILSVLIQKGAR